MILFTDEFKLFFKDSPLQKIADICLRVSLDAFNVNNGNIPKWTIALDELKAIPKGEIELNEPYIRIDQNSADPILLERALKRCAPQGCTPPQHNTKLRGGAGGQSIPPSPFVDVVLYCILIYADVHN